MIESLWLLIVFIGVTFMFSGTVGIIRFPCFFLKIHSASMTDSFGAPLILVGCALKFGFSVTTLKILLLVPIMWIASSLCSYLLCKSKLG
ncbi:monovalent cation/H(+) antiporter subunit G [Neorickettsia sp. 179522]|uniref:monovalent cation/H(+) antiporter subunit G n=1 Tax=Neorickettsia sp. 179522 TaxID=1714371 RepID=UPI00079231F1|nr:cation:proton antiporter [Neorickettsia sp. 179522]